MGFYVGAMLKKDFINHLFLEASATLLKQPSATLYILGYLGNIPQELVGC